MRWTYAGYADLPSVGSYWVAISSTDRFPFEYVSALLWDGEEWYASPYADDPALESDEIVYAWRLRELAPEAPPITRPSRPGRLHLVRSDV